MSENNIPHIVDQGASIMRHEGIKRKPLSDKVIADLKFDYIDVEMFDEGEYGTEYNIYGVEEFARAIEKLHGIE